MIYGKRGTIIRFAIVGTGVAACYFLLYLLFLELGLQQAGANTLAFMIAVTTQYIAQTMWTFRRPLGVPDQIVRFLVAIGCGYVVSLAITGYLGPGLGWPDWLSGGVVTVVLPVQNYLFFRTWVFVEKGRRSRTP